MDAKTLLCWYVHDDECRIMNFFASRKHEVLPCKCVNVRRTFNSLRFVILRATRAKLSPTNSWDCMPEFVNIFSLPHFILGKMENCIFTYLLFDFFLSFFSCCLLRLVNESYLDVRGTRMPSLNFKLKMGKFVEPINFEREF